MTNIRNQRKARDTFLLVGLVFAIIGLAASKEAFLILGAVFLIIGVIRLVRMQSSLST